MAYRNRYQATCAACGEVVAAHEGYLAGTIDGRSLVKCADCFEVDRAEIEDPDRCGWQPPAWVERQLVGGAGVMACTSKCLPGMLVCATHASKEALVVAVLTLAESNNALREQVKRLIDNARADDTTDARDW